ncbi:helix-turn-helix domain-containing protein [Saccharopolyspora erythraea]|uniref:helix-turn-helix domain-containing protein n=1 Tax=Saccharopolyspora erythraea TaxID=1836 RepID=UPI00030CE9F4|nr:helix-turn-helix domain-containing protein [Saccharopolyspora erythraea]
MVLGDDPTDADEGWLFWVGEQLEVKAVDVAEVGVVLRELVGRVLSEFSGKAADRFEEQWVGFELFLERGGAVLSGVGEKVREWALQVQYLKLMTLYGLNLLLAEMAWAVAMAALSFGAGVGAWLAFRFAVMRFLLRSWWGQLFVRLAMAEVAGVGVQLVLDPAVQGTQIAMGTRKPDEWDEKATVDAVGVGAVSGLFALPMAALGNVVGNAVSGVLVRGLGGAVDEEVLVAAARHAVAEHAEKYPISAMARFADAVGQSVKDYGGMSLGGMWAARVGSGLGEAIGEGLTEMFGEWAYTGEFNVFSGTAGSFDRVGEWVGEMGGLGLAGSLLPGGGSPYVASGAGSGSDSDLAPLVGKPSDLDDDAGDDSGYDSGYGSGGDSDAESVWSDEGSGSGSGVEVSGPLGGGAGWSTGPGLGAGAGAGVGESVSAGGGVSGPGGSSTAGAVAGASAGGLAGGSETSGGPSKGAAPAVGGGVSAAAQPGPGTGPVESSGGPGVSPVGGVTGAVPVSQGSVSQGSVSSGTGPAAGGAAGGEHGHGPGVSGSGAVAGVGAVPAASVDGGPVVSSAGSRTGGVVDPATNAGEVWAGDVEGVRSQTPPPPYTEFDTGAFSAPDVSVPPPAYSETEPGTVHSGQDGSGVDSAVGAGDGSGAQTSVPGAVPVGGATAVGSGAAPSLAGLPSGGTEGARVVRVPEPTTGAGTEGVSAEQVRAQLGTGVPSAGGPVVVASQAASGGGVVMSPEQAKTLARELNNDVVVLTPGRRGPRWMRFPANAADGLAVRPSKPDTSPTATRTDLGSLTHASTAAPETAKTPTPTPTGPETVTATADGSTGHTTTTMAAGKPGDLARPADRESTADRRGAGASRKPVTARGHGRSVTLDEGRFPKDESALTVFAAGSARGRWIEGRLLSGEALDAALAARRGGDRRPLRLVACDSAVGGWESDAGRAAVRSGLPVLGVRGWVWQAKRGGRYPEGMASAAMVDGSGRPVLPPNGGYVLFVPGKPEPYDLGSYVPVSLGEVVAAVAAGDMARLDELIANAEATAITAAAVGRMSTTGDAHAAEVYNGADTDWAHWADTDTSHTATGEQTLAQQRVVLGAALKRLRKAKKLAQRDIATWLKEGGEDRGAQSTVSLIESGRYPPNRRELLIMLNAYGVSREERARLQALHDAVDSTRSAPESDRKRAELGNKLKEFREAARLTKAGAARAASLRVKQGGNAISRIENGGIPEKEQLRALLEVYRVPEEEREELEALRDAVDPTRLSGVLGARLKLLRERAKLSQCGAAAVSGVSRTRISAGETGRAVPSVEQLGALLNVYDVSSEVRAEVEALWREAVASGGDGAAVPGAGEGHAGDGGPEAELLRELDSLLRWLHAAPEVLPGLRVQLDEFRADVAELVVRGWPVPYVEAQLGVVRGLAERVRSSAFGFSEEEVRRLGWEVLLGHVEVARESLLQWDEGSVARWFAAADEFLGPWRAYEPLRVLMAHHFMLSPGDQAGAEALREQFRPYVPGGVRGGAGPEPDGDGVSRSPVQAAEGMASDGLEGPADAVREENRQAMLARLERLAAPTDDGIELGSATERISLGARLKTLRDAAGLSQRDAATLSGVDHREISHYELGERVPSEQRLGALLDAYDVPVAERTEIEALRDATVPIPGGQSPSQLGSKLTMLREAAGLSQRAAATQMRIDGINQASISAFESGRAVPSVERLGALLNVYRVSIEESAEVEALRDAAVSVPGEQELAQRRGVLGARLKLLRERAKLSQRGAAAVSGVSRTRISDFETGRDVPSVEKLGALLNVYDVSSEVRAEVEALCREAVASGGDGAAVPGAGEGHAGDGGPEAELLRELDSLLRWLHAAPEVLPGLRVQLDEFRADVAELVVRGWPVPYVEAQLGVVRGLAERVRSSAFGFSEEEVRRLGWEVLLGHVEVARESLLQWDEGSVARWFAAADEFLGPWRAYEPLRVLMAHHFMLSPGDQAGAEALREQFRPYVPGGVRGGAGPEPDGDGVSRSPVQAAEGMASDGLEGPADAVREENRQAMLARLEQLAGTGEDGAGPRSAVDTGDNRQGVDEYAGSVTASEPGSESDSSSVAGVEHIEEYEHTDQDDSSSAPSGTSARDDAERAAYEAAGPLVTAAFGGREESAAAVFQEHREAIGRWLVKHAGTPRAVHEFTAMWNELERPEPESAERRAAPDEAVAAFRHLSVWARELHGSVNLGAAIAAGAEQVRDAARATLNLPGSELVGEAGARAARVAAAMEEMVAYRSYEDGMTPGAAQAPEFASKLRDTYRRLLSEDAFQQESEVERFLSFYAAPLQRATTWLESLGTAGREMAKRRDQARELFGADFADLARSDAERNLLDDLVDLVAHRNVGAEWETPPDELRALARDMREDFEELRWVVDVPAPVALDRVLHARWHETVEVARTTLGTLTEGQRTIAYRLASAFLGEPQPSRLSADAHAAHAAWLYDWAVRYRGTDEAAKRFSGWNGHVLAEMRVTLDWPSVVSDPSVQYYRSRSPVWAAARQEALRAVRRSMRRGAEWLREQARTLLAFPSSGPRLSGELARRRIGLQRRVTEILAWNLEVLRDPALVQPKAVRIRAELDRIDEVAQDGSAARGVHAMIDAYEASTEDAFVSASLGLALVDVDFGQYRDDGGRLLLASRFGLPGAPYGPAERALLDDLVNLLAVRMASGMPESAARDLAESLARDSHMPRTRTNPPDYIAREIVERLADEAGLESAADGSASAPGADAEPPAAPSWLTEINAFREQYARFFDELWADAGARSLSEVEYATKLGHSVFGDLSGLEAAAAEVAEDLVLAHGELMRRHGDGFEESGPERADAFRADWGSEFHTGLRAVAGKVLGQLLPEEPAPESVVRAFSRVPRWRESIDEAYAELHSLVPRWLDKAREELGLPLPEPELSGGLEYEASKLRDELAALVAFEASGSPRNLLRLWQPGDDIKKFAEGLRQEYQEVLTRATNDPDGALVLEYFRDDCRARVDEAKEGLDKLFRSVRDRWIARGREQLGGETFLPELSEARSQLLDDLAVTVGHRMQDRSNQALASAVNLLAENDSEVLETWRGQGHADLGAVLAQSALERDASDWVARLAGYAPHLRADIRSALHALATVEADTAQYWREEGARELVVSDDEHVPDVVASIAGYWLLAHPWPQAADLATQAREAFNVLRDRFDPPLEVVEALLSDDADDSDGSLDYDSASDGWFTPDTRDIDEIDAYVDARAPMAEGVWKGADGRDRPGDPQTWRDWIEHGEELYAWLEKARRMGWWRGRLLARIAALKAEYRLGMTGELAEPHESEPRFELAAEPPYTPEHVANLRDSFGTYALEVLLPLADMLGDGLGDLGAASGVRRMARSLERDVRRFVTAVHDLSARAERDGSVPAQEFESLVRWAGRIQSFVSRNLDGFGFLHSDRDAANALPRVIHSDIRFNVLLAASDIPGRLVSTVRPRYAFDAAVVEVDPNALRRLQDSIQAEGLLWRVDRELLFRKDSRTPAEIKEARGFAPRSSDLAVSLWGYQQVPGESGLVSVSRSESLAAEFRMGGVHYESEYVYEIDALGGIDLVATLGRWTLLPYQQEVVFPGGILWEFVRGWRMVRDGKLGEFTPNPDYDPRGASPSESVSSPEPSGAPMVVRADGDQGFVVGVPGVSYPGPNRPDVLSDRSPQEGPLPPVVNRGDFEIEIVDGTPHVRLYTVVSMPQLPDGDVASGKPPAADVGDVQQDPSTGKILILNARLGRPLSVFVGRPLSALQVLAAAEAELAESQPWRSAVPPVIRSYLVPVDVVRELSGGAVAPEAYPNQANGRVANVWPEFGPNLFAVPQSLVGELAASVAPNSLVTYTSGLGKEELLRGEWAGAVEHIDGLRERLGVPRTELLPEWRPWPTMDELDRGSTWRVRRVGRGLRRHYATWQEVVSQPGGAPSTLPPDESVPFEERKVALEEFVARHLGAGMLGRCVDHGRGGSCVVDEFMESTVRPWADQAAIAEVLAEDHGRMLKDLNITGKGAENDFAALREQRPEREAHQRRVGARITEMWRDEGASPHEIIDYLVAKFPELSHKYDEITVWNERYTYYEHAQMVLGQYLKLARAEAAEDRLVPVDTVVKAILFHDIEKDNAKRQQRSRFEQYRDEFADFGRRGEEAAAEYGDEMARIAREAGAGRHDAAAEHVLAVDMVRRYGGIFADDRQLAIAVDLIDSDPFGFYLMGRHSADDVFEYIARMALRVSGDSGASFGSVPELAESSTRDIQRLFNEFHQYYQADFSSYTSDSTYRKREGSEPLNGLPTFDRYLGFRDGKLTRTADERHFEYSGRYREKFAELAAMFASPEAVRASYERIAPPASDAQSPSGAQRASDGELEAGPESASTAVGEGVRGRHRRRFSRWLRNCFGADSDSEGQRLEGAAVPTAEVASPSVNEADVRVVRDADGEVALVGFLSREGDEAAVANLARRMPAGGHRTYRAKTRVGPVAVTRRRRVPWPRQRPPLYLYVHGDGVSGRVGGGAVGAAAFARMAWSMKVFQEAAVQQRPIVLLSCDARSNPVRDAGFASELAKEFDKRGHAGGLWSVFGSPMVVDTRGRLDLREGKFVYHGERPASTSGGLRSWLTEFDRGRRSTPAARAIFDGHGRRLSLGESDAVSDMEMASSASRAAPQSGTVDDIEMVASPQQGQRGTEAGPSHGSRQARSIESLSVPEAQRMGLVPHALDYPKRISRAKPKPDPLAENLGVWERIGELRSELGQADGADVDRIRAEIDEQRARLSGMLDAFLAAADAGQLADAIGARLQLIDHLRARRRELVEQGTVLSAPGWEVEHLDEQLVHVADEREVLVSEVAKRRLVDRPYQWMVPGARDLEVVRWLKAFGETGERPDAELVGASEEQRVVFDGLAGRPGVSWRELSEAQVAALVVVERKGRAQQRRDEERLLARLHRGGEGMEWAKAYPLNDRAEARVLLEDVRRHMNENMLLATNYNFITPRGVLPFMQARPIPDDAPIPLDKICDDPRQEFRSLWEIIKSERDFFLLRRGAHEERLGYAATLQWDRAERMFRPDRDQRAQLPKYAALVSAYQTDGSAGDRYGAFVMYWEPEVANRATYTPADSIAASGAAGINGVTGANNKLGLLAEASPDVVRLAFAQATDFRHESEEFAEWVRNEGYNPDYIPGTYHGEYIEAQIHGSLRWTDLAAVVINYRDSLEDGAPTLQEAERVRTRLLAHARKHAYGFTVVLHKIGDPPPGPELFDQIKARADVRQAADRGEPISAVELAAKYGKDLSWAFEQIFAVVRADVRQAARQRRPRAVDSLVERFAISPEDAEEQIAIDAREDLRRVADKCPEDHYIDAAVNAPKFGKDPQWLEDRIADAARADVREAADAGRPYTKEDLAKRWKRSHKWANDQIKAALAAAIREAADQGTLLTSDDWGGSYQEWVTRYNVHITLVRDSTSAAVRADVREAAEHGSPHRRAELIRKYGPRHHWHLAGYRYALPNHDRVPVGSPPNRQESDARAEVRASVDRGEPYPVEALAKRYGKSRRWAFEQIAAAAHADVLDAADRGEPYSVEALAERYGMSRRWAASRLRGAHALVRGRYARAWEDASSTAASGSPRTAVELAELHGITVEQAQEQIDNAATGDAYRAAKRGAPYTAATLSRRYGMKGASGVLWAQRRIEVAAYEYARLLESTGAVSAFWLQHHFNLPESQAQQVLARAARANVREAADRGEPYTDDEVLDMYSTPDGTPTELAWVRTQVSLAAQADVREAAARGRPYTAEELAKKYGRDEVWAQAQIEAAAREAMREAIASGEPCDAVEFFERFGVPVRWAKEQIEYLRNMPEHSDADTEVG